MLRKTLWMAAVLLVPAMAAAQTKLLRQPTYANGKIAFSYLGSIWTANEDGTNVQRLTVNQARDVFPRFSPDGSLIAFSSAMWHSRPGCVRPKVEENRSGERDIRLRRITAETVSRRLCNMCP